MYIALMLYAYSTANSGQPAPQDNSNSSAQTTYQATPRPQPDNAENRENDFPLLLRRPPAPTPTPSFYFIHVPTPLPIEPLPKRSPISTYHAPSYVPESTPRPTPKPKIARTYVWNNVAYVIPEDRMKAFEEIRRAGVAKLNKLKKIQDQISAIDAQYRTITKVEIGDRLQRRRDGLVSDQDKTTAEYSKFGSQMDAFMASLPNQ